MNYRQRMSAVDTAWLRMDRPNNLMQITAIMILAEPLDVAAFKACLSARFIKYHRFLQRVATDLTGHYWEDDPHFDLDNHIHRLALPRSGGDAALQALVSDLASTPLARTKPMWDFHVIDNVAGGSAVVTRIHHCYADGIALVQVLLSMTDRARTAPPSSGPLPQPAIPGRRNAAGLLQRLYEPATELVEGSLRRSRELFLESRHLVQEPGELARLARTGIGMLRELAKVSLLPSDPPTRLKGELGTRKQVAWVPALPLTEVKTVGRALGCTVNDVLLSCAAGAIGAYLQEQGNAAEDLSIRASIPVNLRHEERARELGNHFGLVFLELPIGITNPLERVYRVQANMQALKASYQPLMSLGLLSALGLAPEMVQRAAIDLFSDKSSLVMSNVPGPKEPLYLVGNRIVRQMFWMPQSGTIGAGVSILSYNGQVQFGLIADQQLIARPDQVVAGFPREFEKLLLITLMGTWAPEANHVAELALLELAMRDTRYARSN